MNKDITDMTRKEFDALPQRDWNEDIKEFDSLVVLPGRSRDLHDSGYRCMDFVAVRDNKPICRLSGCSDVIHIEGIGGYGKNWVQRYNGVPRLIPPTAWNVDCLPKSGLLHFFPGSRRMTCGNALSSFEIYALPYKEKTDE